MNEMEKLHNLAKEIDANVLAIEQAAREGEQAPTLRPIPGGLGSVTVDGNGSLISVDLDRGALGTQTPAGLGRVVLRTIQQTEAEAIARRDAMVAEAQRKAGIE